MKSIKSVYKIGNGPSSSHTVGPYHAAKFFGERYPQADAFRVILYGSEGRTKVYTLNEIMPLRFDLMD